MSFEFNRELHINGEYSYSAVDMNNVIGIVEGSDLKDEYVVISAHYDHMGKTTSNGKFYPGADDNASGVSTVLEIARILQQAKNEGNGPRRSVIFLFCSAEEEGLVGSNYYANHPTVELGKIKANINIDMIGRIDSKLDTTNIRQNYVYALTGYQNKNAQFTSIIDSINNEHTKLAIPEASSNFFMRSDQFSFYAMAIPSVFFFGGEHPDYHRYSDTPDKIQYALLAKRVELIFLLTWNLANNKTPVFSEN